MAEVGIPPNSPERGEKYGVRVNLQGSKCPIPRNAWAGAVSGYAACLTRQDSQP